MNMAPVSESTKMAWYKVIHDTVPMKEQLHCKKMAPTDICRNCALKDMLQHHLTICRVGRDIWGYAKALMAQML
jgi:hypothetical protein